MKNQLPLIVAAMFLFGGCQRIAETDSGDQDAEVITMDGPPPESLAGEGGGHPEHGPHGGELIELGQETYHGELIHDDKQVTIYVLDGSATKASPINAMTAMLSLRHDGSFRSFILDAAPDDGDNEGFSSRYSSADATLCEWMSHDAEGALMLDIDGKSYTGKIEHHDHDH